MGKSEKLLKVEERLVRARDFWSRIAVSRSKFYEMVRTGELPPALHVSGAIRAWREADIEQFIRDREAAARGQLEEF